jgi:hypothetical protein
MAGIPPEQREVDPFASTSGSEEKDIARILVELEGEVTPSFTALTR